VACKYELHPTQINTWKKEAVANMSSVHASRGRHGFLAIWHGGFYDSSQVKDFIGTPEYEAHKKNRFPPADYAIPIAENEAFILSNHALRDSFRKRFLSTQSLY
jgi:hypothetical protein